MAAIESLPLDLQRIGRRTTAVLFAGQSMLYNMGQVSILDRKEFVCYGRTGNGDGEVVQQ